METTVAEKLFGEFDEGLKKRGIYGLDVPSRDLFSPALLSHDVSHGEYQREFPNLRPQIIKETSDMYHEIELRRVFDTEDIAKHQIGLTHAMLFETWHRKFGFSSKWLLHDLRSSPNLIDAIHEASANGYKRGVLAKFRTRINRSFDDADGKDVDRQYVMTRPLVIVPGVDYNLVIGWEESRILYYFRDGIFSRRKPISKSEWQSL